MKSATPVIDVQGLSLGFDKPLCSELTFSLDAGDKVHIQGRSGSGKSTLLRCLLGFVRPLAGRILILDQPLAQNTVWPLRARMAYVTQEPDLGTGTVRDAILRPFSYRVNTHLHPSDADIGRWCDRFFLPRDLPAQDVTTLSGGQKQRVALITAILLKRNIILLDEPTSALDAVSKVAVAEYFSHSDQTVLWVSHDAGALVEADQIIALAPQADPEDAS